MNTCVFLLKLLTLQISHWNFHSLLLIKPALFQDRI